MYYMEVFDSNHCYQRLQLQLLVLTKGRTVVDKIELRKDILVTEDDYLNLQKSNDNLPKVYPLTLNSDCFKEFKDGFNRKLHGDEPMIKRLIDIEIPTDEDPAKHWRNQFVKIVDASDENNHIKYIFKVLYVDFEIDEYGESLEEFYVSIVPLRKKKIQEIDEEIRKIL